MHETVVVPIKRTAIIGHDHFALTITRRAAGRRDSTPMGCMLSYFIILFFCFSFSFSFSFFFFVLLCLLQSPLFYCIYLLPIYLSRPIFLFNSDVPGKQERRERSEDQIRLAPSRVMSFISLQQRDFRGHWRLTGNFDFEIKLS